VRRLLLLTVLVVGCAGAVSVGSARAISACGTITASTTLAADCAAPLTVGASGITVDLGGHSVLCDSVVTGIVIPSFVSSSTVANGSVSGPVNGGLGNCVNGVDAQGSSDRLISLTATNARGSGFFVSGGSNTLLAVAGNHNFNFGVRVIGSFDTVRLGTFAFNGIGASFGFGDGNGITRSRTFNNNGFGVVVTENAKNTAVTLNTSFDNFGGYLAASGTTGSILFLNQAYLNPFTGIWIQSTSNHNIVLSNGSYLNTLDMRDDNANCDSNLWTFNLFSTANQSCIA
jgi:hypothetical protein